MNKHKKCFLCDSKNLKPLKGYYEKHSLIKCQTCGFIFMENIPSSQELEEYYANYSYNTEEVISPTTIKSYNVLLDEFEEYRQTNKILDVGCGRGWFLIEAKKRGWKVYGTEYSQTAVKLCRENGIEMKEGELDLALFDDKDFDVITSFEVIEHINNPHKELKLIYNLLRKGGLFYCTTPNFNSLMRYYLKDKYNIIEYPEHLSYYTKSTLNKIVKKNDLIPIKFLSTGISISRINASKNVPDKISVTNESSDEVLRKKIDEKWHLKLTKKMVNIFFTITNTGLTLKGYYVKK
jgi:2-polyprenyl-3-methyl-5-hydroxy-6-metoxy-1,4-benzoquinol methylase